MAKTRNILFTQNPRFVCTLILISQNQHHRPPDLHCHIVIKEAQQSAPPDVTLSVSVILIKFNEM